MALTKINASVIANNTIAVGNIADNSVDATKIASNSILTRHIDDDQVTGDQLADNIEIAGSLRLSGLNGGNGLKFDMAGSNDYQIKESSTNDVFSFGGQIHHNISSGKVGIGTTAPDLRLHVDGTNAYPATSGSTPTGMLTLRAKTGGSSHGLFMGVGNASPYGSWLQAADADNLATEYPLLLNPNGGNVGIGTATNPLAKLEVTGSSDGNLTSAIFANSVQGGTNDTVSIELQLAGTSGQVAAGTLIAGKTEDWASGTSRSGYLGIQAVLDGTNTEMARFGSTGDGTKAISFSNAKVGIGTTSPDTLLNLKDTGGIELRLEADSNNNGQEDCFIRFYTDGKTQEGIAGMDNNNSSTLFSGNTENAMVFGTVSNLPVVLATNNTERLQITAAGDVKFNGGPVKGMRQAVQYQGATNATTISANSNATFQSTTITTTGNSKLVVWAHSGQILKLQQNSNPWMRIGVNGTYIGAAHEGHHYWYGISSGTSQRLFLTEFGVSATLAAGTHTVTMQGGTYAADMIFNYQNQSGHMVIMEVGA